MLSFVIKEKPDCSNSRFSFSLMDRFLFSFIDRVWTVPVELINAQSYDWPFLFLICQENAAEGESSDPAPVSQSVGVEQVTPQESISIVEEVKVPIFKDPNFVVGNFNFLLLSPVQKCSSKVYLKWIKLLKMCHRGSSAGGCGLPNILQY